MSLGRLVYYSAILAGWAAFVAWVVAELAILGRLPQVEVLLTAGVVGAAIGCAVNVAAGLSNPSFQALARRALPGLIGGAIGGAIGGMVGNVAYDMGLPRALGWMLMGLGIGVVEGLQEQSFNKIRNGLIGGAAGGLVGGMLFDPIQQLVASESGMSSRAIAFVVLGVTVGACIGLAQVVLKEAWITVVDGYRPGRQLILSRPVTVLGRGEHLPLPFIGTMNREVAIEQARITRQLDGVFVIEDLGGGPRLALNQKPLTSPTTLADGDTIKLGPNVIRFNERQARRALPLTSVDSPKPPPPPPPAPRLAPRLGSPAPAPLTESTPPRKPTSPVALPRQAANISRPPPPIPPPPKR